MKRPKNDQESSQVINKSKMETRKFVFLIFSIALILKSLDLTTTYIGIVHLGLEESNPTTALFIEEYSLLSGLLRATQWSLYSLSTVALLSIPRVGPTLATIVLGGFAGSFLPAVLSNISLIAFNRGLSYAKNVELQWYFFALGAIATYLLMDRMTQALPSSSPSRK